DGLAEVARALPFPIASGERLVTRWEFRELLEKRACAIIQPDVSHSGGISEVRRIAAMAETYQVAVACHNPQGPVSTTASLQLGFATPNYLIQEAVRLYVPWRHEVVNIMIKIESLTAYAPYSSRLGIEINEKAAAKYPFQLEIKISALRRDG